VRGRLRLRHLSSVKLINIIECNKERILCIGDCCRHVPINYGLRCGRA
jgi:hypothetical protein